MSVLSKAAILAATIGRTLRVAAVALPQDTVLTTTTALTSDTPRVDLFPYETVILTDEDVQNYPVLQFADTIYSDEPVIESASTYAKKRDIVSQICKVIPSDEEWPSDALWETVSTLTEKGLIKTIPSAASCYYGDFYNATRCLEVTNEWTDSDFHNEDPTSIMSPFFEGLSCLPTTNPNGSCTLGGYPNYVVKATNILDVQVAVNFARNTNLRLVVKNTGHDFSGKSSGANSISVWTHFFKDIAYIPSYNGSGDYNGPAFKVGSGVQGFEIYKAAYDRGLVVVGGEGITVGYSGGYLQGGGHSPLSSIHGMGADHVLALEIVTADGRFVTADSQRNSDLFWALRGGGGSTFGVVSSVIVKAYPDIPVTTATFDFAISDSVSNDSFWEAVKAYLTTFTTMVDSGAYSYFDIDSGVFYMSPFFGPNLTADEVETLFAPLFNKLDELNIPYTPNITTYDSFYPAWYENFPKEAVGGTNVQTASRLFPRANWQNDSIFDATFDAIRSVVDFEGFLIAFNIAPTLEAGGNPDNSVNPAWRETVLHAITGTLWSTNATEEEILAARDELTYVQMQKWRDVCPESGAYLGESDIREPNFQQAFYGTNYDRLYQIKQKYDPEGVFFAVTAVGSEDWDLNDAGRLCRK